MFNFEKLLVWQKSISFNRKVYEISLKFPKEEVFGITSQLRRASISISSNIAEGSGRKSAKEFKRFLSIAYGSVCEAISILKICLDLKYISDAKHNDLYNELQEVAKMLSGLSDSKL
ncbi:MAG: four helix bundle protein [Elusimicrobiota bacterium]|nr:four helix bundle protein [Elusimicrobiota bacterium]